MLSSSITLSANASYYTSYSISRTATFRYSTLSSTDALSSDNASGTTKTATGIEYMSYNGTKDITTSAITIPSEVTSSTGGVYAGTYSGLTTSSGFPGNPSVASTATAPCVVYFLTIS